MHGKEMRGKNLTAQTIIQGILFYVSVNVSGQRASFGQYPE